MNAKLGDLYDRMASDEDRQRVVDKALEMSIAKWQALADGDPNGSETIGPDDCPLCSIFNREPYRGCVGCPVRKATGHAFCVNSPWEDVRSILPSHVIAGSFRFITAFLNASREEVEFLKTLRTLRTQNMNTVNFTYTNNKVYKPGSIFRDPTTGDLKILVQISITNQFIAASLKDGSSQAPQPESKDAVTGLEFIAESMVITVEHP